MKSFHRGLLLAASTLVVLLLASPAPAISTFTEFKCDYPSDAAEDTYDYFDEFPLNTENLDESDCETLCKELRAICQKNSDNRVECMKADDQFWYKLQDKLCDANYEDSESRKNCKNSVKSQRDSCKEELAGEKDQGRSNCENRFGSESSCWGDCNDGTFDDD